MTRCDFRSHRECMCLPGECHQTKPMLDLRETPVIRPNVAKHFFCVLFVTAFMASMGWFALSRANDAYGKQAKINQENVYVSRR